MAVAIPFIGAGVAVAAGAGTALGLALSVREKVKHTKSEVTQLMNLTEGDHISLKKKGNLPFRHAVVVRPVRDAKDRTRVMYHSGWKSSARVELIEVDLSEQARNGDLLRHRYEAVICYPPEAVVARAMSLCLQDNSSDRREVIRNYWPFFRDDKHFANWCQIGFCFTDGMLAVLFSEYTRTPVSDVARLNEGRLWLLYAVHSGDIRSLRERRDRKMRFVCPL